MKSYRILAVYLTLAALLFGNVAGWLHVGCSAHRGDCCVSASTATMEAATVDTTIADSSADSSADDPSGFSCCQCGHGRSCQPAGFAKESRPSHSDTRPPMPSPGSDVPGSDVPGSEHDSDRCSICQSFFGSRHAVLTVDAGSGIESLVVCRDLIHVDDVFAANDHLRSHTVRGPPSV